MKKFCSFCLLFLITVCFLVYQSFACTTFCLKSKGEVLFGKNYDWNIGDGLIIVNKRGVKKVSTVENEANPVKWISKYGSVTFNQYGRENPNGGMNETGLVIELMWLNDTEYPKADQRPTVDVLEWIQFQLDTAATVEEVLKNTQTSRVTSDFKIHYLVSDKNGNTATIEFIDGKLVVQTGVANLTNDTYQKSVDFAKNTPLEKAKSDTSLDRFARSSEKIKQFEKQPKTEQEAVKYAFEVLADVVQKDYTQWSIVYDQKRGKIYFRTLQSPTIKSLDTKSFNYSCATNVKIFDINSKGSGDITPKFTDYTRQANRDLIEHSFNGTDGLKEIPKFYRNLAASYPEEFACSLGDQKSDYVKLDVFKNTESYLSY